MLASYSFSKTFTDGPDGLWQGVGAIRNWYCRRCDYAVSSYDQPHRFITNLTYELPIGKGKLWGSQWSTWMDTLLGQW